MHHKTITAIKTALATIPGDAEFVSAIKCVAVIAKGDLTIRIHQNGEYTRTGAWGFEIDRGGEVVQSFRFPADYGGGSAFLFRAADVVPYALRSAQEIELEIELLRLSREQDEADLLEAGDLLIHSGNVEAVYAEMVASGDLDPDLYLAEELAELLGRPGIPYQEVAAQIRDLVARYPQASGSPLGHRGVEGVIGWGESGC